MNGYLSEEALEAYAKLVAEAKGMDFSEGETYDFARCVRADGSAYGTRGKCHKGTEADPAEEKATAARAERQKAGAANRLAQAGAADAAKRADKKKGPHHAQLEEMKSAIKGKLPDLKQRKEELDRLERAYKAQEKKTKEDPSKENKARLKEIIRQANDQERHFNRLEREIEKMSKQYRSLNKRNEKARMSPAQRKEANRIEALIRKLG